MVVMKIDNDVIIVCISDCVCVVLMNMLLSRKF